MADVNTGESKTYDPFESFRGVRDAYLDSLSKTMVDVVNTESYAQATGAMLDAYLSASAPFREMLEKAMQQTMQQFSLPTRQELASLAERFTNVEMRLDDIDAKLDALIREKAAQAAASEPAANAPAHPENAPRRNAPSAGPHK